ncbi:MAG: T9SS type A sorting domain-containing protein [Muribaculaceae bacterium]|nr:T9SS type A sorting domain-containing protein [Muribaculaceae bacterium]
MALAVTTTGISMGQTITEYPYTPPFTKNQAAGWTTYKAGYGSWSNSVGDGYWQNNVGSGLSNSWLFSPALELKGGYKYTFTYTTAVASTNYPKEINQSFLLRSAQSTAEKVFEGPLTTMSATELSITSTFEYTCSNNETVYFALYNTTNGSDKGWKTNFSNFSVEEEADVKKPNAVTDFTVTPAEDGSRTATLAWVNPTTYNTGDPLVINSIQVLRDGELIATLSDPAQLQAGATVTYTDTFPTSGKKVYTVKVIDADGVESIKEITTPYLGPIEPMSIPYEDNFSDSETYDFWTIKNIPAEGAESYQGNSWTLAGTGMYCSLGGSNANNSWAYTPPVALKAGKAYKLTFVHKIDNKSNPFPYKITLGKGTNPESESIELLGDENYISGLAYSNITFTKEFSVEEDGTYNLGINSYGKLSSSSYSNKMTVTKIALEEIPLVPEAVTNFAIVSGTDDAIEATLSFKMPEVSETGVALSELQAEIARDGEVIATLDCTPGEEVTYNDNAEKGLTAGFHKYQVVAVMGEGRSAASGILSTSFLGGAIDVPFTSDFENGNALWTVIDNSTTGGKAFTFSNGHAVLDEGSGNKTRLNDWLITPMLKMQAGKSYEVTIEAKSITTSTYSGVRITPDLHLGTSNSVESMASEKNQLSFNNTQSEVVKIVVTPTEGTEHTLGLHVTSPSANANGIEVYSIHVEEMATRPAVITDAKAKSAEEGNEVTISWTMPAKSDYNADLTEDMVMTANVKRQGAEESLVMLENLAPGQAVSWTDTNAAQGINTYEIYTSVVSSGDVIGGTSEATIVSSDYVGAAKNLPYTADFANAGSEWIQLKESGNYEYQFDVEGHEGHAYLLAGANEDASATYKNWLVTPALNLKAGKAYNLYFTARSKPKSTGYAIDYMVYVSKSPTVEGMKAGKKITPSTNPKVTEKELTARSIDFEVEDDGKYFIGYFVDAGTDSAVSEVGEWVVTQSLVTPQAALNTNAAINEEGYVTVSFNAPMQNMLGGALPEVLEARLYRDNEETPCVVTEVAPGAHGEMTATDSDAKYHSYALTIAIADEGESASKNLGTFYVGAPATIPYAADFANNSGEWKISNIGVGNTIVDMTEEGLKLSTADSNSENIKVYAYSPIIEFAPNQIYRLKAKINSTDRNTSIKVSINPEGGTPQMLANTTKMETGDNELSYDFKVNTSGKSTFSIYVERGYYCSDIVTLSDITLTTAASTPTSPTMLSAVDNEEEMKVTFEFKMPVKGILGENLAEDAELSANVYVNGVESTTISGKTPGEVVSMVLEMPSNGIHTLGVSATLGDETSEIATIKTDWIGGGLKIGEGESYSPELTEEGLAGYITHKNDTYTGWNINSSGLEATGKGEYWLITTPFELNPDHQYKISFTHRLKAGYTGTLQAYLGEGQHKDFMETPITEEISTTSSKVTTEQVFDINGMINESEENPEETPAASPRKEAGAATKHYIAIKASNLTGSTWTTPAIGIEDFAVSHHKTITTGVEMIQMDGITLTADGVTLAQPGDIRIFATDGRLELAAINATQLSTNSLQSGVHIVTITSGGKTITLKFNK